MTAHVHPISVAGFAGLALMWEAMMTAMMTPVVWPWLGAYRRLTGRPLVPFAAGYLTAWIGYSIAAAGVQAASVAAAAVLHSHAARAVVPAVLLVVAGAYQFLPIKRACLTHCRHPLSFLLMRWRGGSSGGYRLGLAHGAYCVGCCWALMLTTLAVGMAALWWMAVLTAVAVVEQVVPRGDLARIPVGIALILAGVRLFAV